jgi:hypothetical protein
MTLGRFVCWRRDLWWLWWWWLQVIIIPLAGGHIRSHHKARLELQLSLRFEHSVFAESTVSHESTWVGSLYLHATDFKSEKLTLGSLHNQRMGCSLLFTTTTTTNNNITEDVFYPFLLQDVLRHDHDEMLIYRHTHYSLCVVIVSLYTESWSYSGHWIKSTHTVLLERVLGEH